MKITCQKPDGTMSLMGHQHVGVEPLYSVNPCGEVALPGYWDVNGIHHVEAHWITLLFWSMGYVTSEKWCQAHSVYPCAYCSKHPAIGDASSEG